MMADMDVHADVSEVNEKCALDMSTYENLPNACNASPLDSAASIPKDNTDASYVFVNSTDAATSDDHVVSDLNGQPECSHNVDTEIKVHNGEFCTDDGRKPDSFFVSNASEDSPFKFSEHLKVSDAIQDETRVVDVLQSSDAKVDEAEPGLDSSQKVEETRILENQAVNELFDAEKNSGEIYGVDAPQEDENVQIQEENQIISTTESSNTDANLGGQILVVSSQMVEDIQIHEDNGVMGIMKSSNTKANHGIDIEAESSQNAEGIQFRKEYGIVAIKFSDPESNTGEEIEVESSRKADEVQNHEENGRVKAFNLTDTAATLRGKIKLESSKKADDIQNGEENVRMKAFDLSCTVANPRGKIEVESSQKGDDILNDEENGRVKAFNLSDTEVDIQNHKENGIMKAPKLSNTEANPRSEIEVESPGEGEDIKLNGQNEIVDAVKSSATVDKRGQGEVVPEDNETVAINELSDTIENRSEETELDSFEREEGIRESQDANVEAADCHSGKEKVDEMVNKAAISDPVGGLGESQIINGEDSLLEPSEENKVDMEQHLAAAPSPLVNSEDLNGSISTSTATSMDQDDPSKTIDDKDTGANTSSFHDHTETLSSSVDPDIDSVETHKLTHTMLINDPKVELNEITVNEQEVNHVLELEETSETASHPKVDECDRVEVLEGTVSGDEMSIALDESRTSYGDDSVAGSQLIPVEVEPAQSVETAVSSVVIGNTSVEIRKMSCTHSLDDPVLRPDLEAEDCTMSENVASADDYVQLDNEVRENHEISLLLGDNNFETKSESGDIEEENQSTFPCNDMRSESNDFISIECEERGSTVPEVPNGGNKSTAIQQSSAVETDSEFRDNERSLSPTANEKSGENIEIASSVVGGGRDITSDDCTSETEVKGSAVNDEVDLNPMSDIASQTDSKPTKEETEVVHSCQNEPSPISPEGSIEALAGKNVGTEAGTKPLNFLVRVPKFGDVNIREQIKSAQMEVDQTTKDRDAIRVQIQIVRAAWKVLSDNLEAAVSEGRAARDLLKSKRQEIDSVQSVITKVKNAMSIGDIDGRVRSIEHSIEHETLPLKEEKQLIREIKQLKQLREQLSSTTGKQNELQQALDQKDQFEERLRLLRKEMDLLRGNVLKAESVIKAAKKICNDESLKLDELQSKFKAADKIRQEAYANLQSLRKQLYDKNKYYWKYRDDVKEANEIASSGDVERLQRFSVNQVECMMELWNTNAEFREEYIKTNMRSTLRRLKTLDGRSLGPNEEPHALNHIVKERPARDNSLSTVSKTLEPEKLIPAENMRDNDKPVIEVVKTKNQPTKNKKPTTVVALVNGLGNISCENDVEEPPRPVEIKRTREEEELAAKAEELRKKEEAIKLKEQHKLEEKTKAKEALERKSRNAEKAHARAATKARKEAEEREKLREKRAKKKARKMAAAETEAGNGLEERESGIITESTPKEVSENTGKQGTAAKRPQKASQSQYTKHSKTKSTIPPHLRNRSKRGMQPWMWVLLATLIVFVVFFVGATTASILGLGF
ncbi:uncharacterized protein LOC111480984 [Cucurbita maxima]|uniref:Uncharacterized protein LOC111480984 n=1 Tax=Cucurbita maxima TaxID=3661 RepID=A0A6J1J1D0_CUCMA|nr:uncharacterized protein LOC111480984 [Cucurbita maxima]XP_022982001.1 uncharacterized protein LOC111480984 [Cucurbita maxima]XP_022982002.1 uncharacterized protein LOC111480984 [Cucurbita maxima]